MTELVDAIISNNLPHFFTSQDLAGVYDDFESSLPKAVEDKDIIRLHDNLYALADQYRNTMLDDYALANRLYPDSYISCEMALRIHNWIPEEVWSFTCVTSNQPYVAYIPPFRYSYLHIEQKKLYCGVEKRTLYIDPCMLAKPLKALADYIFKMGHKWTTLEPLYESMRIYEENLEELTSSDFDELQGNYDISIVENFLAGIRKELGL